ncbi:MAG: 6-pyruvoyl-tetrahydropterin synthase-related protein [Anaerolineae bacterium]
MSAVPRAVRHRPRFSGEGSYLGLALLLSLAAALPLLIGPGIINTRAGGDSPFLVQRVHQLSANLGAGIFPARWMPDAAYGLGYPFFSFYAAFPYYLAAVMNLAGAGVLWGIKLTQALGFLAAGGWAYLLIRRMGGGAPTALLGSALYTYAPFHLVNVYVRGDSLSEFYAMALYPAILWGVLRLRETPSPGRAAFLAAAYALLVLSHNISALLFSPLVGLWLLVAALGVNSTHRIRVLWMGAAALILGLALSAWFWAPALREQGLVQLQDQTTGYFHFANHLRATDLIQPAWIHDYRIDDIRDPFAMGLVQALLGVAGSAALIVRAVARRRIDGLQVLALLAVAAYTLLITPVSSWVWEHVPLLPYTQFPWRLLSVQALALALVTPAVIAWLPQRARLSVALGLCALVAVAGLGGLRVDRLPLREADITPERLSLYETFSGNIGSTVRNEYLPRAMQPRPYAWADPYAPKPAPLALEGQLVAAQPLEVLPGRETWHVDVATPVLLAFQTTYLPGWEAQVDGNRQGVEPLQGLGLVGLRLEPGAHEVSLRFEGAPVRRYTAWLSLAALLAWMSLALAPCLRSPTYRRRVLGVGLACAVLTGWIALGPGAIARSTAGEGSAPAGELLVADFSRAPYLHRESAVRWGDATMTGYRLSTERPVPGEVVTLNLKWEGSAPAYTVRVQLLSATAHLFEPAPVWAEATAEIVASETTLALALPDHLAPGLYVPRVEVWAEGEALTPRTSEGQEMGTLWLAPINVTEGSRAAGNEQALAGFGPEQQPPAISLLDASARLLPGSERLVEVALTWRCERQAPLNYVLSVRLDEEGGGRLAMRDLPPLLGGYSTALWRPGELLDERVVLELPEAPAEDARYRLEIVLYDRVTLGAVGTATVAGVTWP